MIGFERLNVITKKLKPIIRVEVCDLRKNRPDPNLEIPDRRDFSFANLGWRDYNLAMEDQHHWKKYRDQRDAKNRRHRRDLT